MSDSDITNISSSIENEPTQAIPAFSPRKRDDLKGFQGRPAPADRAGSLAPEGVRQGDVVGQQDYTDWQRDMWDRRQRAEQDLAGRQAEKQEKSKEIDVISEIDAALIAAETGLQDFESSFGQPNTALISARSEVDRLRSELALTESKLAEIEAQGDSVERLARSIATQAEGDLIGLVKHAKSQALRKLIHARFGWGYAVRQGA